MKTEFTCSKCGQTKTNDSDFTTGYGTDDKGNKVCFECCGKDDALKLSNLAQKERHYLYLDTTAKTLSNWPGTFKINLGYIKTGRHNITGKRYDTWFTFSGNKYHAVQYGDNTQIAHVKRIAG